MKSPFSNDMFKKLYLNITTPIVNMLNKYNVSPNVKIAIVITLIIFVWMLTGIASDSKQDKQSTPAKISIKFDTKTYKATLYNPMMNISGRIKSDKNILVLSQVGGNIEQIFVKSGQRVKKGSLIVKISGGDSGTGLKQALSNLRAAKLKFNADTKLYKKKLLSKAGFAYANSSYQTAESVYASKKQTNDKYYIKAPYSGKIGVVRIIENQAISPDTQILDISSGNGYKIISYVSSKKVNEISIGSAFKGMTTNRAIVSGKITGISMVPEQATKTYRVEGKVTQTNFANGQSATIQINLKPQMAHSISASLLSIDNNGDLGIKIINKGIVEFKTVTILNENLKTLWVTGLPNKVQIITKGAGFAKVGTKL